MTLCHGTSCIKEYLSNINSYYVLFQPISNADFIVPVEIDNVIHQVYVLKRPYVDEFLCRMGELFECVLFTASLAKVIIDPRDCCKKTDSHIYSLWL